MHFFYCCEIGVPAKGKAVYVKRRGVIKTVNNKKLRENKLFKLTDCKRYINIHFCDKTGVFNSIDCALGDLAALPEVKLNFYGAPDCFFYLRPDEETFMDTATFIEPILMPASFDRDKKIVLFGRFEEDYATFKVNENVCVCLDGEAGLAGLLILL